MKRYFGGVLSAILFLMFPTLVSSAATYYIRTDGGTADQCTGTTDAAYTGSGVNQPCAWSHPFWTLDGSGNWKITGGDTIVIYPGSYQIGYGAPNTGWCDPEGAFDCVLPPLPSGPDAQNPTRLLGAGHDSGCTDPPELWGTQRVNHLLSLEGTSHAEIQCLELTDHSGCVEFHSHQSVSCERDTYPYGDWAATGIFASDSSHVTLKHLHIHGLASSGIHAGRLTDWTVEDVSIAGNGWVGWDGDLWEDSSNSGTLTFRRLTVEWNGCAETYPDEQPDHCWDQTAGGYGDGFGIADSAGHWVFEDCAFDYNTSDGLDLLYVGRVSGQDSMIEIRRTRAIGNAGNPIKTAGPTQIVNSLMVANCGFFNQKSFGQEMNDHCRAGGNAIALTLYKGDTASVVNCTIVGEGDVLVEVECGSLKCDGSESASLQNNIFRGYADFLSPGDWTAFLWDPSDFTDGMIDYNVIHDIKEATCPFGSHDRCADPLFVHDALASFDGHLQSGSPAIDRGLPVGSLGGLVPSDDLGGGARPAGSGVDIGAYEYGAKGATTSSSTTTAPGSTSTTTTIKEGLCSAEKIYGEHSEEAALLRYLRDSVLSQTPAGREIVILYYQWSPAIVKAMEEDEEFKEDVKEMMDGVLGLIMERRKQEFSSVLQD